MRKSVIVPSKSKGPAGPIRTPFGGQVRVRDNQGLGKSRINIWTIHGGPARMIAGALMPLSRRRQAQIFKAIIQNR